MGTPHSSHLITQEVTFYPLACAWCPPVLSPQQPGASTVCCCLTLHREMPALLRLLCLQLVSELDCQGKQLFKDQLGT